MYGRRSWFVLPFPLVSLQLTLQAWYLQVAAGLVLPAFMAGENVSSVVGKAARSQGTASSTTPSLSDIPTQEPTTSEDCLFLDVLAPQKIYESPRRTEKNGKGGGVHIQTSQNKQSLTSGSTGSSLDLWWWIYIGRQKWPR